ncbi:MAG: gliding motility-associated C-terminal domain-containing protein [Flavobacteriales bacterium]|jgi:gliding motility-associated-like protein|nr:gliding motility-associated C-terminal domain-containing protein [Flavobacteriales bacterium]
MKLLFILFIPFSCFSQQVLSSGGNAPSPTNISEQTISFTIGEPLITTGGDDELITEGFQQPHIKGKVYVAGVNAFSPNNDGNNDTWLYKKPSEQYQIEIFSRWGNIVWNNTEDLSNSEWDGTDSNGNVLPDGTYFYTIKVNGKALENGSGYIEITR